MPYISQSDRGILAKPLGDLLNVISEKIKKAGDYGSEDGVVNYIITEILLNIYNHRSYSCWNRAVGVLECVKQELYRRAIVPYEETKIKENGDLTWG